MVCSVRRLCVLASAAAFCGTLAIAAVAQTSSTGTGAEFRDPKTGKLWTPNNVSQDDKAPAAATTGQDKAFDPQSQRGSIEGVSIQRPRAQLMGVLPITSGPSVPLVTIDGASLMALPGDRWITALYVTNNSGATLDVVIGCLFTNAERKVEDTRVIVPPAGPGERLALQVQGPRVELFVDRVTCRIISPG